MTSEVTYNDNLRTNAIHLRSQTAIETDAPTDNQGKGERFSPTDLTATALASCMLTLMGIWAKRLNISIKGTTAKVQKVMQSKPRKIARIIVEITLPEGHYTDNNRLLLEKAALNCPVAKSLDPAIEQNVTFNW